MTDDNITFNGRTAVHAESNGTLTTSDVCGVPPFCVPMPFTNIAKSKDATNTSTTTFVNDNPICNAESFFAISAGDEAGTCGGVVSGTIKGKAEFLTFSPNIFDNGIPVVRANDMMVSNNRNTPPAPLIQSGVGKPPVFVDNSPAVLEAAGIQDDGDWTMVSDKPGLVKAQVNTVDTEETD